MNTIKPYLLTTLFPVALLMFVIGFGGQVYAHEMKLAKAGDTSTVHYHQVDGPIYWVHSTQVLHNDSCSLYLTGTGRFTRVPTGLNCNFCGGDGKGVVDLDNHAKEDRVDFEYVK